jgi:ribosomal protein S8E
MDSQFNTLTQSFSNNYIEFQVTGDPKYQSAYTSSMQGLQNIVNSLKQNVDDQKKNISDFYRSGIVETIHENEANKKLMQRGILTQTDNIIENDMRENAPVPVESVSINQYIALGVTGVILVGLTLL